MKQFTPPMAVINNPNPKLVMDPTIIAPPDTPLPNVNMPVWGDPLAKIGPAIERHWFGRRYRQRLGRRRGFG